MNVLTRTVSTMQLETKFLRLRTPVMIGSRFGDWRVSWLGGSTRHRLSYLVMVVRVTRDESPPAAEKTGFYKVPSLKGVWYRGHFLHDGSLATLEELFDPARLNSDLQAKGWNPPGVTRRAVPGHEFGLSLTPDERRQLIAFLRTL
jgi:hypothetical protein